MKSKTGKLKEFCKIVAGATPSRAVQKYWDGDIPWITPKDIARLENKVFMNAPEKITKEGLESCSSTMLPKGTVLFSSRAPIGHVAIAGVELCTNQGFKSVVPGPEVDSLYLYYLLKSKVPEIQAKGRGATFAEINKEAMEELKVVFPPLPEQHRIAKMLDRADALRQKQAEVQRMAGDLVPAVFDEMFGKQRVSAQRTKGVTLGDLGEIITGNTPPRDNVANYGDFIEWVKTDNINDARGTVEKSLERLSESGSHKGRIVPANSVLVTCIAGSIGHIGDAAVTNRKVAINQQINAIVPRQGIESEFLLALVKSLKLTIRANATGAMTRLLNKSRLAMIPAISPEKKMQVKFSNVVKKTRAFEQKQVERGQMIGELAASLAEKAFK